MELNRRSIGARDHSYERTSDVIQPERTRQIGESPQGIINGTRNTANPFLGSAQRNRSGRSSGQQMKASKLGSPGKSGSNQSSLLLAAQSSKLLNVQDSTPSVSEPHANEYRAATETEEYKKLLQQTGLQVHPKQQAQMFKDKKVQKFLKQQSNNNQQLDTRTMDILARAGNTQASIAQKTNQYGRGEDTGSKEPQQEAPENEGRSPIQDKFHNEFQHIIESNLKEQIAKEIAYQIQQNIQITLKTPKEADQQSVTDQSSSNNPTPAQKTKKKITNSQKKSLNFIRKGTFSSQQKTQFGKQEATHGYKGKISANPADPLDINNQMEKKARKKSTQPYSNQTSTKKSNIRFTEDEDDDVDYSMQQPSGSRRGVVKSKSSQASNNFSRKQDSNKSPSGRSLLIGRSEPSKGQTALKSYKNQLLEKSLSKKKFQSGSNSARGQQRDDDEPQPNVQQAKGSPNDTEQIADPMNQDSARQLQEKMKQISVYDLYQITNQNGSIPIDTFIKQQLMQSQQILPASKDRNERSPPVSPIPGVAPQVKKVASGTSSQKSLSSVNIHIGSVIQRAEQLEEQKVGSGLLRHRGQQPSTIPETVDENNSLIGTPVKQGSVQIDFPEDSPLKEESKINLLQDSRISKKLQKEANSRNDEAVIVTKANKAKTADALKKSYENFKTKLNSSGLNKEAEQPKSTIERTPKSQRKEKPMNSKSNKYLLNLNKKYVSQSPNKLGNHSFLDEKADNRRSLSPLLYHGRTALGANTGPNRQSASNFTSKRTSLNALDEEETNQFKLIEQSFQEPIRTSLQLFNQNHRKKSPNEKQSPSNQNQERITSSFEPGTLAKNRNSMIDLSLQKNETYQELREQNLFFVRKQTTPKVQIIKGLQEKYSSKMKWNNTIEEEQHELTRSINEGKHEKLQKAVESQMRDQNELRSSQPRNAAGLTTKGNTTERTFVMKAQINLLLEGEAKAQLSDEGLDSKNAKSGRRDRQARSNSRQVLEASRPLSEQSMGRLSQNTAQGALRRTRKDRSNNGKRVLSPPSDYQEAVPKSDNANLSQNAAQPGSTLFQNLINSRLEANGTPGAGRATPTPHLQISELSSNLHFGEVVEDYKAEPTQAKPFNQKLKSGKAASKSQNRIKPNPYQYYPGSDKKQADSFKAKGSGRSLNATKRSGKGTKKSANKSYKKSDSRRNSTDMGDMMLGEPQMPLGKSFQIIQGNEDNNPFTKGLSQSMVQSGLKYGAAKTQAELLQHQKVQNKRKEMKKSNQKSLNQRTSSRQRNESYDNRQQQFQQFAGGTEEGMVDIPPSIFDKSMGAIGATPTIPQINKNAQKNRDLAPSRSHMEMEHQIKNYRKQLNQQLSQINFVNHRELDQIKKPQKYMFFAAYLFKVLFDLITQIHNLNLQFQNKKNKKYKDMIANDFNQDLDITKQSEGAAPDEEDDTEDQLMKRVHQKYFMHAEQDLKAFIYFLPLEQNSKPAISQVDKVILNEWQTKLKPFLSQNTQQFQNQVSELSKRLKRLIENSEDSQTDLQQIKDFALRIIEYLDVYANLYNACTKAGKIFGRIVEIVKNACCYAYKKCEKTLLKSNANSALHVRTQEDEDFDRDGDENPLEQIEHDNRNKSALDIVENDAIEVGQDRPQYAVNMFQDQDNMNGLDIQRRMTVDEKKSQKKDGFQQASHQVSASKRHSEMSNGPKKGSSFLTQLIEQQSQKQKVFDYGASSHLAQPSVHDDPLNFKIQLQPVDIDSELSQFENESNKQSEKSNKMIEAPAAQEHAAAALSNQPEPTSSPQSQMQSCRLENSLKQGYEFSKFAAESDPSAPQTPAAVESQKPIELEQDKIEYEIEQPHSETGLAEDDSSALRQSGIFGVDKALYEDQVTTNSSANKGFTSAAVTVDAASEQTKSAQQSVVVEKQGEGQIVDLDQIKIQVDEKDHKEEEKQQVSSTPKEYFSFDHEEPPNPEPRSPEPTTPTKQQKPLLLVSVDASSYDSPKPSHPSSQQASKEEASTEQEQATPMGNTQKVQDMIDELRAQMLLNSQSRPTGNLLLSHTKKKSSANPYLSSSSASVSQQASAPNSKESSPKKPEAGQKKLLQKFTPEYGLYNPEYGILLYQNDPDFDNEIDNFRIIPMKIFARTSQTQPSSASKLARRSPGGSPLVGSANSRGSRGSVNKSRRVAESNGGSATKAVVRQRLGTNPGGSGVRTSTLLGKPRVEPPQILERTNEDSLNESININLGTSPFPPYQPPEARKPLSSDELMEKFQAKIGDTANPYNQASRSKSRGDPSNERASKALDKSIAEKRLLQKQNENKRGNTDLADVSDSIVESK